MTNKNAAAEILRLIEIMATLRSPGGCPWDRKQTPETLKPYILEETYELMEAIDRKDVTEICDELGDLLLQIIFLTQIYNEQNIFGLADVAFSISKKMIRRHPHVFAGENAENHAERWSEIKQQERRSKGQGNKLVDRIPTNLPALKKATKVSAKMEKENPDIQVHEIQRKLSILKSLTEQPPLNQQQIEESIGQIFFSTVQLANSLNCDAEDLLRKKTIQVMTEFDFKKEVI